MVETTTSWNRPSSIDEPSSVAALFAVTATSQLLVAANPDRVALVMSNLNAGNAIWVGLGQDAVVSQGIRLNGATAGTLDGSNIFTIDFFTGAVYVIATGTRNLAYYEL